MAYAILCGAHLAQTRVVRARPGMPKFHAHLVCEHESGPTILYLPPDVGPSTKMGFPRMVKESQTLGIPEYPGWPVTF